MENNGKMIYDLASLRLPADMRHLLQCRHISVYDALVLLANTMNKVDGELKVRDKEMDAFMAKVLEIMHGGEGGAGEVTIRPSNGTVDRATLTAAFSEWLDRVVVTDLSIESPNENAEMKWRLKMQRNHSWDNGQPAFAEIDLSQLVNECKQSDVSALTWWTELSQHNIKVNVTDKKNKTSYLFDIPDVDKQSNTSGLMTPADKTKLDGIVFDTTHHILNVNGTNYKLTPVDVEVTVVGYEYSVPVITNFGYSEISAKGGGVIPKFKITQTYKIKYSNGTETVSEISSNRLQDARIQGFDVTFEYVNNDNLTVFTDEDGNVSTGASTTSIKNKVSTVTMYVTNRNDEGNHSAHESAAVYQAAAELALSNLVNTSNVNAAGSTITVPITVKTDGVVISDIVSTDNNVATATLNADGTAIVITVRKNEIVGQRRSCTITVNSNIGQRTIEVSQLGAVKEYYCYSGKAANMSDIPEDVTTGVSTKCSTNGATVITKSDTAGYRIHWVAVPSGYKITAEPRDSDNDPESFSSITRGDYTIYYVGSDDSGYIRTEYTWTVIKN